MNMMNVGILVFNEVEVLDFAGPFEVFSITERNHEKCFNVFLISENDQILKARNGLLIKANYTIKNCPNIDILIIPGGYGAEKIEIHNETLLKWIVKMYTTCMYLCSVCTGTFLLAKAGVIINHTVTTHWLDIEELQTQYPNLEVKRNKKYIDLGKIITSGGISSGIEMSLHLVSKIINIEIANYTAKRMEYNWEET